MNKLVGKFNEWADEIILGLEYMPPLSDSHRTSLLARIDMLRSAKINLERLEKEIEFTGKWFKDPEHALVDAALKKED